MNLTVCPLRGPGLISSHGVAYQGIFPWLITFHQPVLSRLGQKMAQSPLIGTTQPVDIKEEDWSPTTDTRTDGQNG